MEFRIADTFIYSLSRLTGKEQKAFKTTTFDLQLNPSSLSLRYHKLDLEEVYNIKRHLLYAACTRARDCILVTGVDPAFEFLDNLV